MLLNSGGDGLSLVPPAPAGTYVANNLAVTVNGVVNGDYPTGPDQIVDGNLYWRVDGTGGDDLLGNAATVPAFSRATGLERDGVGEAAGKGSDPASPASGWTSPAPPPAAGSCVPAPRSSSRPTSCCGGGAGDRRRDRHPGPPAPGPPARHQVLPGTSGPPYGTDAASYEDFPFVPGAPAR